MKSSTQLIRLLNLVPYLQNKGTVDISQVAADFGTTATQVLKDLEVLQFCGLPEGYFDDLFHVDLEGAREDGYVSLSNADVLRRPRKLRRDEATSLLVALELVTETTGGSQAATSALRKLRAALGEQPDSVLVSVVGGDPETSRQLQTAIESQQLIRITHAGRTGTRAHVVEPTGLRTIDGDAYLDAWSRDANGWRSFRLDRIVDLSPMAENFDAREGTSAVRDWFDDASELVLGLEPHATWVSEYFPTTAVQPMTDQIQVSFPVVSTSWGAELVLRLGPVVLTISDAEVASRAVAEAQEALRHYD